MSPSPPFDVVRVVDLAAAGPAQLDQVAEELAVLARAGMRSALAVTGGRAGEGVPVALRHAVESGHARMPAGTVRARVALLDGAPGAALPAGVEAVEVLDPGPLGPVLDLPAWWLGRPAPSPQRPAVVGVLLAPGGRLASTRALRGELREALVGLTVVVLLPPGAAAPSGIPPTWLVRTLDRRSGVAALLGVDIVVELPPPGGTQPGTDTGRELGRARVAAAGAPLLRVAGAGRALHVVREPDSEPVPLAALRGRLLGAAADPLAAQVNTRRTRELAAMRYGPQRLLAAVGGSESGDRRVDVLPGAEAARPRVLFVSSNGAGMGHLTRLLAMARHASDRVEPVVASLSQAVAVAVPDAVPWRYLPSAGDLGIGIRRWNVLFGRRLGEVLRSVAPAAVVYDGTYPYLPLLASREDHPGVRYVWSRRGMWRKGLGAAQLGRSHLFDLVIEPGELAAAADEGPTVGRGDARVVRPITLLDEGDLLDREAACAELGLDPRRPSALVTLGAGNLADIGSQLGAVVNAAVAVPGMQVCVTRPVISSTAQELGGDVRSVSAYPLSRLTRAFDFSVGSAGYNSFHESIAFALPTIFVPVATQMDDQPARARWAAQAGVGLHLDEVTPVGIRDALPVLTERASRERIAARCRDVWPGNGARDAMRAVEDLVAGAAGADLVAQASS